jgi:hypothetical protein
VKRKRFKPSLIQPILEEPPRGINRGKCFAWAYLAHLMFEGVELWDTNCHAFVKAGNRFYDAERLQGVEDWRELPAIKRRRWRGMAKHLGSKRTPHRFRRRWGWLARLWFRSWPNLARMAKGERRPSVVRNWDWHSQ